jgi:hypothetical protein
MVAAPVDTSLAVSGFEIYAFPAPPAGILDVNRYSRQTTSFAEWVRQLMGIT